MTDLDRRLATVPIDHQPDAVETLGLTGLLLAAAATAIHALVGLATVAITAQAALGLGHPATIAQLAHYALATSLLTLTSAGLLAAFLLVTAASALRDAPRGGDGP